MGLLLLLLGLVGAAVTVGTSVASNNANAASTDATNAANLEAVKATNAANVEQAELAYKRSLPINQVKNLMDAGMSRAGALQSITGGGTYTAPVLQSAQSNAKSFDYSGIASAMERLTNIPSNVTQQQLQEQQLERINEELRMKQEAHQLEMQERLQRIDAGKYTKWERESKDNFFAKLEAKAQELNIQPNTNQSFHEYVRALGLQDDPDYRSLPVSARLEAFNQFKQVQAEKREQIAAADKHNISVYDVKEARQRLKQAKATYDDYMSEKNARQKEYHLRELRAELESLAADCGISKQEFDMQLKYMYDETNGFHRDKRGRLVFQNGGTVGESWDSISSGFDRFWQGVFKIIPINALGKSVLGDLIKFGV